jgi:hypothetical protein
MVTQQTQIKLNIPVALRKFLEIKANQFGIPLASYIKHLILKDVEDMVYPTYEASGSTIKAYKKALKEKDKSILVKDVDAFFKEL